MMTLTEAYLDPGRISTMNFFCENVYRKIAFTAFSLALVF